MLYLMAYQDCFYTIWVISLYMLRITWETIRESHYELPYKLHGKLPAVARESDCGLHGKHQIITRKLRCE